jgi:glycosyltransferase involved in cell wall biosynthesis
MTFRKILLAMFSQLKNAGRHFESYLRNEDHQTTNSMLSPVIGYDKYLTENKGRALICYLTEPFHLSPDLPEMVSHQKMERSLKIAQVFNRLGYIVDLIGWRDDTFVPKDNYKVLFGSGSSFTRMVSILPKTVIKIYFALGPYHDNIILAEKERKDAIRQRRGVTLQSQYKLRLEDYPPKGLDAIIIIHDDKAGETYSHICKNIYPIDSGGFDFLHSNIDGKDFVESRKNFLWMGNWLFATKGLDLLLETFSRLPKLHLFICGPIWNEPAFIDVYEREFFHFPNIHVLGQVDLRSEQFRELTNKCAFVIYPGAITGLPGAVWAPMRCGVIPIISQNVIISSSMQIPFEILPDCSLQTIHDKLLEVSAMDSVECQVLAGKVSEEANRIYSLEAWSERFEGALRSIFVQRGIS